MSRIVDPIAMSKLLFDDDVTRYSTAVAAWTPLALGAALKAWWSADDHGTANMTDDGAGLISSWKDRKNTVTATATTTARPTWGATSFSGKAGLTFDGVANCLAAVTITLLPTGANAGELWASINHTGPQSGAGYIVSYGGTGVAAKREMLRFFTDSIANHLRIDDAQVTLTDRLGAVLDGYHIVGGNWAGTTEAGRVDGALLTDGLPAVPDGTQSATIATLNTGTTRLRIGANNAASASGFYAGGIRHVLVTTTLTLAQRLQLEGWLAWDVGIASVLPVNHPFRAEVP